MKLGSFFSLEGFDNGRRTGAIGLVTYTFPGLLAVLFGGGQWLWVPGLVLALIFGLSLKRRCRDAVRPRGYLVATLAPLPLWLLCLTFGWNLAFALVCFALGLAATLLMAVLPSRPAKDYDEGYWHPDMPAPEPQLPRREPVLGAGESHWDARFDDDEQNPHAEEYDADADDLNDYPEHGQGSQAADKVSHLRRARDEDDDWEADDQESDGRALHDSHPDPIAFEHQRQPARSFLRAASADDFDTQTLDEQDFTHKSQALRPDNMATLAARQPANESWTAYADDEDSHVGHSRVNHSRVNNSRNHSRDHAGSQYDDDEQTPGIWRKLWPFSGARNKLLERTGALRAKANGLDDGIDGNRADGINSRWDEAELAHGEAEDGFSLGADERSSATPVKGRTWSEAFNGEGSLEVLMEAIYFHLKHWWRFYLSGAAALMVITGVTFISMNWSERPETVKPADVVSEPALAHRGVTLESGLSLKLDGEALILGWPGQLTDSATLWSLASGEGDKYCATALFNNGNRYRPLTVSSANSLREARFSPLDTQAIVRDLALRGNVQLCGQAFGLKGSQAVIGSDERFASLLTP